MSLAGQGSNPLLTKRSREVMLNAEIRRAYRLEKETLRRECQEIKKQVREETREARYAETQFKAETRKLGLDPDKVWALYQKHDRRCEICGTHEDNLAKRLHVDHCHTTGEFRGFLCWRCNGGIGFLQDDIEVLRQAIKYLENR